jgi:hypothetical protein
LTEDRTEATDAWVGTTRFGFRVRRWEAGQQYADEFTIRHAELPKIISKEVQYMLYAVASREASESDSDTDTLESWKVIDLASIRRAARNGWYGVLKSWHSDFLAVDLPSLEDAHGPAVVASGDTTTTTTRTIHADGSTTTSRSTTTTTHRAALGVQGTSGKQTQHGCFDVTAAANLHR